MSIYKQPLYYEIAFGFFDVKMQIDCFEEIIKRFSKIKVHRVLDLACGPSLQLRELARRGYRCVGLDSSSEMLAYLRDKAHEEGLEIETIKADMSVFKLQTKVDYAFVMMGSLTFSSDAKLMKHLDSLSSCLKPGGLYFIQNKAIDWTQTKPQRWIMKKDGISATVSWSEKLVDPVKQIFRATLATTVNDSGSKKEFRDVDEFKFVFPQEFKTLVKLHGKFEFVGWWEGTESAWFLDKPLEKARKPSNINCTLLRKL
jgi:SAM-dependent methyltransferase